MTIRDLVTKNDNVRISLGNQWLVYDNVFREWVVYQQKYHQRVKKLISTKSEEEAIKTLMIGAIND